MKYVFLTLFLSVGLVPNISAADQFSTHYFAISFLLIIYFIWSLFKSEYFFNPFKHQNLKYYCFFFLFSCLTVFYSINKTESIIVLSRILIWVLTTIAIINIINNDSRLINFSIAIISLICVIEAGVIFSGFLKNFDFTKEFGRSGSNRGLAANINIAAFSLINKLPFLVYLVSFLIKKRVIKLILFPFVVLSFFSISITGSRGALLATYFIVLCLLIILFLNRKRSSRKDLGLYTIIFVGGFALSSFFTEIIFDTLRVSYRTEQIIARGSKSRIRYYTQTFNYFKNNPLKGTGIGNWKIQSINEDRENIEGYVVPYHAHNDFLQISAETGIIGFLFYFTFFLSIILRLLKKVTRVRDVKIYLPIFLFLTTYLIDSSLNFPFSRPINNIVLFSAISFLPFKKLEIRNKYYIVISILISICLAISSFLVYKSHVEQTQLLYDFNNNPRLKLPLEKALKSNITYPNLSATALPLGAMIGRYQYENGNIEKAKELLMSSKKHSPYIQINNYYLAKVYESSGERDSALFYYNMANEKLPLNKLHAYDRMRFLSENYDNEVKIDKIFNRIKYQEEYLIWKFYVEFKVNSVRVSEINITEKKETILNLIDEAKILFPKDESDFERYSQILIYGSDKVIAAKEISEKGINKIEEKKFDDAIKLFKNAMNIFPQEFSNYENLAFSYLSIQKPEEALIFLEEEKIKCDFIPNKGNYEYLLGLTYYALKNKSEACKNFKIAKQKGKKEANTFNKICF